MSITIPYLNAAALCPVGAVRTDDDDDDDDDGDDDDDDDPI